MKKLVLAIASASLVAATSCGPSQPANAPKGAPKHEGALRWYPLDAGMQWVYMIRDSQLDARMMSVTKVVSVDKGFAIVQTGADRAMFRVVPDGIVREPAGGYLLKTPPRVGEKWPAAEGAQVEVTSVDVRVNVEAGMFDGCAVTTERFPNGETIDRTFCPDVGPVVIEAKGLTEQGTIATTRAELRSFGMPETIAK